MNEIVSVNDLSFRYSEAPVFSQVSFSISRGDFVVFIGANGAGKSTLFRLLLGELTPPTGEVRLFGEQWGRFNKRHVIGYLQQNRFAANVDFPATVEEVVMANLFLQIGFLRFPKKEHRKKVAEALEQAGMEEFAKRRIGDLSGGQLQRAMLASVLVNDPELLLLDEPTSGVDSSAVQSLFDLLAAMNRDSSLTVMMITHDIGRAIEYASRILCLENGSLVELDKAQVYEELSHKHKHPAQSARLREKAGVHVDF
ncbi:MAG: ABC transporter ATP-binding protein [Synergistaceae bacterium]|jgi:zinc transport system ATP-binding protein|nr:ABC transporter ATP-binding protein [Synergistaceae bacterium]